jgi:hypothetical protein
LIGSLLHDAFGRVQDSVIILSLSLRGEREKNENKPRDGDNVARVVDGDG